jgi:hypothetical protein
MRRALPGLAKCEQVVIANGQRKAARFVFGDATTIVAARPSSPQRRN